jgi:hypothetical protein
MRLSASMTARALHFRNPAIVADANHQIDTPKGMARIVNDAVGDNFAVRDHHVFIIRGE